MPKKEKSEKKKRGKNKKSKSKKEEIKEKTKKEIVQEIPSLENKIQNTEQEIDREEFQNFLESPETVKISPSLKKINAPQREFVRIEQNLSDLALSDEDEEEFDPRKYNATSKTKEEPKYISISQNYDAIQKEMRQANPHLTMKESSLVNLDEKNIVEGFPKQSFNPITAEELQNQKDDSYVFTSQFRDIDRKPHNPFERKETKYEV